MLIIFHYSLHARFETSFNVPTTAMKMRHSYDLSIVAIIDNIWKIQLEQSFSRFIFTLNSIYNLRERNHLRLQINSSICCTLKLKNQTKKNTIDVIYVTGILTSQ